MIIAQVSKLLALIDHQLRHEKRRFVLLTDPEEASDDVFESGCEGIAAPCAEVSESVNDDFATMLDADVLVVGSSILSTWAATIGTQRLVLTVPW